MTILYIHVVMHGTVKEMNWNEWSMSIKYRDKLKHDYFVLFEGRLATIHY